MSKQVAAIFGGKKSQDDGGAKAAMEATQRQLDEQKAETERMRVQNEEQRREEAEKLASRRSARLRGGARQLLSEARLTPETGLQQTLGSSEMK